MEDGTAPGTALTEDGDDLGEAQVPSIVPLWKDLEPTDLNDPVDPTVHRSKKVGSWRLFGASRRGRSHAHAGTYREDAFSVATASHGDHSLWWACAVSDGAGSSPLSRVGSNLAVERVAEVLRTEVSLHERPEEFLRKSVAEALKVLWHEYALRSCELRDLSCTLLVLLWIESEDGKGSASIFHAGDGMIAIIDGQGSVQPMASPDGEAYAGTTHFFAGDHVKKTWDQRFSTISFGDPPRGFLVMSDGVSDDLIPLRTNGPILVKEMLRICNTDDPGESLLDLLGYEKRGSFDDRTLVCALRRDETFKKASDGLETQPELLE